jgi:hypothetical protein
VSVEGGDGTSVDRFVKKPTNGLVITNVFDHTYMFRSPSATILRVYNIKEYNDKLCMANLPKI